MRCESDQQDRTYTTYKTYQKADTGLVSRRSAKAEGHQATPLTVFLGRLWARDDRVG
jgi:hypothetical protein